jgi:putative ABC transport system permease protein
VLALRWLADGRRILVSSAIGGVAAGAAGMLATRRVLSAPPSVTLRALQE